MQEQVKEDNLLSEYSIRPKLSIYKAQKQAIPFLVMKRIVDVIITVVLLVPAIILIGIFAIIIKLESRGSAFYTQERVGLNGKYFKLIKLRSMRMDAEKNGARWAAKEDPRVTKVGAFIRKCRIDELPQLFNVLRGQMSLIGPRPERPMFTAEFSKDIPGFINRVAVKPGVTGWAQVNGGYDITPEEKLKLDLYYIENYSFKMETKILFKTIKTVLTGDGAR